MRRGFFTLIVALLALSLAAVSAEAHPPTVGPTESSAYWTFSSNSRAVDLGARHGNDCAEKEYHRNVWDCTTEYYIRRPNGTPGTRIFIVSGEVSWTGTYVNPYGPGLFGHPHAQSFPAYSWIRYRHRDGAGCLWQWRVRGDVISNIPCGSAADLIDHGDAHSGYASGTGTGDWPWLYAFPCTRHGDWTTCRNKVGDFYSYRGPFRSRPGGIDLV